MKRCLPKSFSMDGWSSRPLPFWSCPKVPFPQFVPFLKYQGFCRCSAHDFESSINFFWGLTSQLHLHDAATVIKTKGIIRLLVVPVLAALFTKPLYSVRWFFHSFSHICAKSQSYLQNVVSKKCINIRGSLLNQWLTSLSLIHALTFSITTFC